MKLNVLKDVSDADKAKLNTLLQQIAWDTVSHHPMTGVRKTGPD
ncbi:MAG TPA: hypothetical protein PLB55_20585 [Prosthecobacter sp.]|nr:hypothetical protein [Prosthecobacter sp.]